MLEKKHIRSCCTQTSASDLVPEADECVAGIKVDVLLFAGYAEMLINRVSPCFSWQLCWWSFNLCTEGAPGTARQYKAESFCLSCQTNRRTVRGYDVLHRQNRNCHRLWCSLTTNRQTSVQGRKTCTEPLALSVTHLEFEKETRWIQAEWAYSAFMWCQENESLTGDIQSEKPLAL